MNSAAIARPARPNSNRPVSALPAWREQLIQSGAEMSLELTNAGNIIAHIRLSPKAVSDGVLEMAMSGIRQTWKNAIFRIENARHGWVSLKILLDLVGTAYEGEWLLISLRPRSFPLALKWKEREINTQSWRLLGIVKSQVARNTGIETGASLETQKKLNREYWGLVRKFTEDFPEEGKKLLLKRRL